MNDGDWDKAIECLVAEVTDTAYAVALRHGAGGSWVDLELELWEALARTVRKWDRLSSVVRATACCPSMFCTMIRSKRSMP